MATVYDKSSLFLAPSGVSNGTVFVQKPVPIYGSEQVTNGDFSQEGAELITNGDFATDSGWTKGAGWSISGGAANCNGTTANLVSNIPITPSIGKLGKLRFEITNYVSGQIALSLNGTGGSDTGTLTPENGFYEFDLFGVMQANSTFITIYSTAFIGSIDNVSVKEVGQDWTQTGANWSFGNNKAIANGTSQGSLQQITSTIAVGSKYKINYTISDYVAGDIRFYFGGVFTDFESSNGSYSQVVTSTNTSGAIVTSINTPFNGSITNISVQEVLSPDGDFTFTRGSNLSATRVNEAQLIEKGRENLLVQSNQFDTTWALSGASVTSGQAGYDGSNDAWLLEKSATNGRVFQNISQSGVQTFSVYAKSGTNNWAFLLVNGGGNPNQWYDLENGVLGNSSSTPIDSSITSVGNGWYKISITFNETISRVRIYVADSNNSNSGTTGSIYVQDAQLEQGLAATSVITTGGGTVQAGLLENTPRLDYSGGATCPSLLLEPSRANLITQSEYYNTAWSLTSASVTDNAVASPEGVQNASKLIPANGTGGNRSISKLYESLTGLHTFSVFAKAGEYGYISLRARNGPGSFAMFDLTNGLVHATNTNAQMVSGSPKIEDYGNGWYRCSIVFDPSGSATPGQLFLSYSAGITGDETTAFSGDGTSGIYIWGSVFEAGSYPTSYIPTYGTSQTRAVDNTAALDLSPFGLNGEDVTHFIEFKNNQAIARDNGGTSFRFNSNSANFGGLRIYRSNSNSKQLTVVFQDTNGNFVPNGYEMTSLNPKVAIKRVWPTGEIKVFVDGNKVIDAASTLYNSWNIVYMEGTGSAVEVKQLVSFPAALSDLECEILTGATTYETFDEMALALNYTVYE